MPSMSRSVNKPLPFSPSLFFLSLSLLLSSTVLFGQAGADAVQKPHPPNMLIDTDLARTPVTGRSIPVGAGADLQSLINSAQPGDELVIQAGTVFTGNFILPAKVGSGGWVTIRTSNINSLPREGHRVSPVDAVNMPMIVAAGVGPAFALSPTASRYRLMGLEITAQPKQLLNYGLITEIDAGDSKVSSLPSNVIFDRDFVHGQVLCHCKLGILMNGISFSVINSYLADFHGVGQDTQAVLGYATPGPLKITNNYLEAAGENIMLGGAYSALPEVRPSDVEFRYNHVAKPRCWMNSLVPPPQGITTQAQSGGALGAGTYYYSIIALGTAGWDTSVPGVLQSTRSVEVTAKLGNGQNAVRLDWVEPHYGDPSDLRLADNYVIFRTTDVPSAPNRTWVYYAYLPPGTPQASQSFIDVGSTPGLGYAEWPRTWSVKNLLEVKNGTRILIDSNVFEYNWANSQNGHAILFTPRSEVGADGSQQMLHNTTQDILFSNNIVRHVASVFNILSSDYFIPTAQYSQIVPAARISIVNNLLDDIDGDTYLGGGSWLDIGSSPDGVPGVTDLRVDHNTAIQTGKIGSAAFTNMRPTLGRFLFTNNITPNGDYGLHIDASANDWSTMRRLFDNPVWQSNVVALNSLYPGYTNAPGDFFPPSMLSVGFVDFHGGNGGDYELAPASPYKGRASDGTDPGVRYDSLPPADGSGKSPVVFSINAGMPGVEITVDGLTYIAPQSFNWMPGETHSVGVPSPQMLGSGTRYVFDRWSDGGAPTHVLRVSVASTLNVLLKTQYRISTSTTIGGTIWPATGFFDAGGITIKATPNTGYVFTRFDGALQGGAGTQTITLSSPTSVSAVFTQLPPVSPLVVSPANLGFNCLTSGSIQKTLVVSGALGTLGVSTSNGGGWLGVKPAASTGGSINVTVYCTQLAQPNSQGSIKIVSGSVTAEVPVVAVRLPGLIAH